MVDFCSRRRKNKITQINLLKYVNDIAGKYEHSVTMCYSIIHGVMPNDEGVLSGINGKIVGIG